MDAEYRTLRLWLFSCCALVFLMISVGAVTRLTGSGLSIAEWKPLMGAIPPLSESEWARVFDLYKQSPEFQKKNFWMELGDFKAIFFWEWMHRFLGRLIGIAFGLPLLLFWARRKIPPGYKSKLLGVFVLGGLQGAMGWYMVKSGLVSRPEVSHYRLAAHLFLALMIYAAMLWMGLSLKEKRAGDQRLFVHGLIVLALLLLTICWGAFTAGLDAGLIYNGSFPKMGVGFAPPDFWALVPAWRNFVENPAAVQFIHRWLAVGSVAMIAGFWGHACLRKQTFPALHALALAGFIQAGLGIATLLSGVWLPLAVLHQAGAVLTLTLLLMCLRRLKSPAP